MLDSNYLPSIGRRSIIFLRATPQFSISHSDSLRAACGGCSLDARCSGYHPFSVLYKYAERSQTDPAPFYIEKSAALSLEGLTVGALIHRWISLVRANEILSAHGRRSDNGLRHCSTVQWIDLFAKRSLLIENDLLCDFSNIISSFQIILWRLRKCFPLCYTKTKHYNKVCDIHARRFRDSSCCWQAFQHG